MSNKRKLRDPQRRKANLDALRKELAEHPKLRPGVGRKQRRFEMRLALRRAEKLEREREQGEGSDAGDD